VSTPSSQPITRLLTASGRGDEAARRELWSLVYDELHRIACIQFASEAAARTIQPTALVNEACLRLLGNDHVEWADRRHFFGVAARIMRHIRVDDARRRKRLKRGGGRRPASLDAATDRRPELARVACGSDEDPSETLALDEALGRLEQFAPRSAEVVMLRFYAGLTREQIGELLGIAARTVDNEWYAARAWLRRELSE
jgi:RNA polymerase sigma factor (TIGR02999 family)